MIELRRQDFITCYPPYNMLRPEHVPQVWEPGEINIYVHIPFCVRKCSFCYYKSVVPRGPEAMQEYVNALIREIRMLAERPEVQAHQAYSLYFGGGTPTILTARQLEDVISTIRSSFRFKPDFEFCVEARPGEETSLEKLELLKELGVHRLSLGVQSLNDQILALNGRNHGVREFYETFERARQVGFYSLNVDLMSGLLGETPATWQQSVDGLLRLRPENIAIYKFELYYNTHLFRAVRSDPEQMMSDADEAASVRRAFEWIRAAGYLQMDDIGWKITPAHDHIHRRRTYLNRQMLGIGLSSHSWFNGHIFQNCSEFPQYYEAVASGRPPIARAYPVSKRAEMSRMMIFGMKNLHVSRSDFRAHFGIDPTEIFGRELADLEQQGYLTVTEDEVLVNPDYSMFCDDLARVFYKPEYRGMMLAHMRRS